jgi:hypothetical protein
MAYDQDGALLSHVAGADLSTHQWKAVVLDSNGQLQLNTVSGGRILGILQDDPKAAQSGTVKDHETSKAVAGGTFAIGANLMSDTVGRMIVATTGLHIVATALEAGVVGRVVAVRLKYQGVV